MTASVRALRAALASSLALAASACVSHAHGEMAAARAQYERCVAAQSVRACVAERERMLAAERSYQESAQRAWGCDPAQADCPTRR